MVSEGVDIPRLRVGVYATTTTTELFFRQAVGRLVRWTRGLPRQPAWLFIPDDPRLRGHAARIAEHRRHSLRRGDGEPRLEEPPGPRREPADEQMSLFAVISAVATAASEPAAHAFPGDHETVDDAIPTEVELILAPPPPLAGDGPAASGAEGPRRLTRSDEKQQLRHANAQLARQLVRRSGLTHAEVNAELNRQSGVRRVSEATAEELDRRLSAAERWLHTA
jgi:hypothetical protein